jgi:Zn-dependent hydrolases, including glyoxylases
METNDPIDLLIKTITVSPFQQNARVIIDPNAKKAIVIDPGDETDMILHSIDPKEIQITDIVLTHCHIDHAGGVKTLLYLIEKENLPKPKLHYHKNETPIAQAIEDYAATMNLDPNQYQNPPQPDNYLNDNDSISIGNITAKVILTPGHSPGHISLLIDPLTWQEDTYYASQKAHSPLLIGGDVLFKGSIGRTDLPLAHHETLIESIKTKLFTLPDTTTVFSGHGPNTTIINEKETNPFLK